MSDLGGISPRLDELLEVFGPERFRVNTETGAGGFRASIVELRLAPSRHVPVAVKNMRLGSRSCPASRALDLEDIGRVFRLHYGYLPPLKSTAREEWLLCDLDKLDEQSIAHAMLVDDEGEL